MSRESSPKGDTGVRAPLASLRCPAPHVWTPEPQASGVSQGRPLRARGQRTLQRLLEAGAEVFAERGYHAARVDDIVHAASTSHGTFYLYFSSKQDLFRALAVEAAGEMVELARSLPPLTPDRAGYDALHEWLGQFADLYARCGAVIRTWTDAEIVDSDFGRIGGDLVGQFSQGAGAAAPRGRSRPRRPRRVRRRWSR